MFQSNFYYGSIRKYVVLFGSIFSDILIDRIDQVSGSQLKQVKVPVSYGPKDRYLTRLKENPNLLREINQLLPRMSFEIKSIEYDASRKLNTVNRNKKASDGTSVYSQYNPVPYNINIDLAVLARNSDDACRIIEQILPYFTPEWTTSINLIPEMDIVKDIPIVLKSVQHEDSYEGSYESKYAVVWNLQFILKGYFYGPIASSSVIKSTTVNFYVPNTNTAAQGVGLSLKDEWVTVHPGLDANGNPTSNSSISVNSNLIYANSNYGFIEDFFTNIK